MGNAALELLKKIMDYYPFEGGGNCTKAAVFHSHMLNDLKPAYDAIVAARGAYTPSEPDDETPLTDVVISAPATEEE